MTVLRIMRRLLDRSASLIGEDVIIRIKDIQGRG